ncbi:MAG: TetR/AcrR family transcriptional regulator [Actinobacteria bacterium]|nr:MAG: TetR/AcrR family transcriptional regulator [Actinomycetota bacterium]
MAAPLQGSPTRERRTQAERRAASRAALLDAAVDCLVNDGYANLTTRRVAERAGVSQGTQMHYFPTKTQFLTEAIRHVAQRLAREALARANLDEPDELARHEAILEELWRIHNGPVFQATLELWIAARTDRALASAMRKLEREVTQLMLDSAGELLPDRHEDASFRVFLDATLALMRGLAMTRAVDGASVVDRRWQAIKPHLLALAAR